MESDKTIIIAHAPENSRVRLEEIEGGRNLKTKIFQIGLKKGDEIRILQNQRWGPLILVKEEIKIALGKGMAQHIKVRVVSTGEEP